MKKVLFILALGLLLNCSARTYIVKPGDTLWRISQNHNTKVETLKRINGLRSNTITVGQRLKINASPKNVTPQTIIPKGISPLPLRAPEWRGFLPNINPASWLTAFGNFLPGDPVRARPNVKPIGLIEMLPRANRSFKTFLPTPKPRKVSLQTVRVEKKEVPSDFIKNLTRQVQLDRAGFSPGVIDGRAGHFTQQALKLCPKAALSHVRNISATQTVQFQPSWNSYINQHLPLTPSGHPDFKALTRDQTPMLYSSMAEMIAERYHCKEELLQKLNPRVDFSRLYAGQRLTVPNVASFNVERYYSAATAEGLWTGELGKGKSSRHIVINKESKILSLWDGNNIIRAFPVTVNSYATPAGNRDVDLIAPAPLYKRSKTNLLLKAGPNSPVGIVWCAIGNGYGIHGTNNPDQIGRNSSSGCVRLANWDIVRLAAMIRVGSPVTIIENSRSLNATTSEIAHR